MPLRHTTDRYLVPPQEASHDEKLLYCQVYVSQGPALQGTMVLGMLDPHNAESTAVPSASRHCTTRD
jgi:hypothetical protein